MGNAPSSVPVGTSINLVNATLLCTQTYTGNGNSQNVNIPFTFSVTAPLVIDQFGGSTNYYDIAATFALPQSLVNNAGEYGGTYLANATAVLAASDSNPSSFTISAGQFNDFRNNVVSIPADRNKVLDPQGPIKASLSEGVKLTDLTFESVDLSLQFLLSNGQHIDSPYTFSCPGNLNPHVLATSYSDLQHLQPIAAGNGFTADFPPTARGEKTSIINTPIACNIEGEFGYIVGGTAPALLLGASTEINLTNFQNFLTIPGSLTQTESTRCGPGTYRLIFNSGKNYNGDDLPGPAIGARLNGVNTGTANVNYKDVDLSRDFNVTDSINDQPLHVARTVEFNTSTPVTFPLPLDGSLTYSAEPYYNGPFSVVASSIQGSLITGKDGARVDELNIICRALGNAFLTAPNILPNSPPSP